MRWFRLYNEIIDDPKIAKLSDFSFSAFIKLMAFCSDRDNAGVISDSLQDVCWRLRMRPEKLRIAISDLEKAEIIKREDGRLVLINWEKRQFKSDDIKQRVRRFRGAPRNVTRNVTRNVSCNALDTDTDTDTETEEDKSVCAAHAPEQVTNEKDSQKKRKQFAPPTEDEMRSYFISLGSDQVEAAKCYDYYVANGWRVGRNPMRDWRAAARNWRSRVYDYGGRGRQAQTVRQPLPTKFLNPDTGEYEEG